ncbi:MAG: MoaD/ThiS family protein [Pseudomonadota bacterium]
MTADGVAITVRLFAALRDLAGVAQVALTVPAGSDQRSLAQAVAQALQQPALLEALCAPNVRMIVNQALTAHDAGTGRRLEAGDEVAFLPPVTGG